MALISKRTFIGLSADTPVDVHRWQNCPNRFRHPGNPGQVLELRDVADLVQLLQLGAVLGIQTIRHIVQRRGVPRLRNAVRARVGRLGCQGMAHVDQLLQIDLKQLPLWLHRFSQFPRHL